MQASKLWMPRPEPRVEQAAAQSGTAQPRSKLEAALALLHDDGDVTKTLDAARCKLTPAEIRALAEAILNKKGSLNAIDLRDCGLEPEGCRTLCEAMGEVYTLEELRMCSNLLHGDGEPGLKWKDVGRQKPKAGTEIDNENLAHFLRLGQVEFSKEELNEFDLSNLSCDDYIKVGVPPGLMWEESSSGRPADGVEINNHGLTEALRGSSGSHSFSKEDWAAFDVPSLPDNCYVYITGVGKYFRPNKDGTYFQPSGNGAFAVADLLCRSNVNSTLEKLDLRYCRADDAGCRALCRAVGTHLYLTELNLSGNLITDEAARDLAESLENAISLKKLHLADTQLQLTGCRAICEASQREERLKELHLPFNKEIPLEMCHVFAEFLLASTRLQTLNLHSCEVDAAGFEPLADSMFHREEKEQEEQEDALQRGVIFDKEPFRLIGLDLTHHLGQLRQQKEDQLAMDEENAKKLELDDSRPGTSTGDSRPQTGHASHPQPNASRAQTAATQKSTASEQRKRAEGVTTVVSQGQRGPHDLWITEYSIQANVRAIEEDSLATAFLIKDDSVMQQIFQSIDLNRNGRVEMNELHEALERLGQPVSAEEVKAVYATFISFSHEESKNAKLDLATFCRAMKSPGAIDLNLWLNLPVEDQEAKKMAEEKARHTAHLLIENLSASLGAKELEYEGLKKYGVEMKPSVQMAPFQFIQEAIHETCSKQDLDVLIEYCHARQISRARIFPHGGKKQAKDVLDEEEKARVAISDVVQRLRDHDETFTEVAVTRKFSLMRSVAEAAKTSMQKAVEQLSHAGPLELDQMQELAAMRKLAMYRAHDAADAERIGTKQCSVLSRALAQSCIVKQLQLYDCGFRSPECKLLCNGLRHCVSLESLDLSFNFIGDEGAQSIAEVLESKKCAALTSIRVIRCGITETGTFALVANGVRRGQLRARPVTLDGVALSVVAPKLNLPKLRGGWNSKKMLAFLHHELGGDIVHFEEPKATIGRTREDIDREIAGMRAAVEANRAASRKAADDYFHAARTLAQALQRGPEEGRAASKFADECALAAIQAATRLLSPEVLTLFETWDKEFERTFANVSTELGLPPGQSYQGWLDSMILFRSLEELEDLARQTEQREAQDRERAKRGLDKL